MFSSTGAGSTAERGSSTGTGGGSGPSWLRSSRARVRRVRAHFDPRSYYRSAAFRNRLNSRVGTSVCDLHGVLQHGVANDSLRIQAEVDLHIVSKTVSSFE